MSDRYFPSCCMTIPECRPVPVFLNVGWSVHPQRWDSGRLGRSKRLWIKDAVGVGVWRVAEQRISFSRQKRELVVVQEHEDHRFREQWVHNRLLHRVDAVRMAF
jgi:hypothetical protein